jgi:hypothetical protein
LSKRINFLTISYCEATSAHDEQIPPSEHIDSALEQY